MHKQWKVYTASEVLADSSIAGRYYPYKYAMQMTRIIVYLSFNPIYAKNSCLPVCHSFC